ncbi:hypothetical protein BU15DRAFT_61917 [Melanogaster broomeanus]|nr:hypothetical protein BU15DRAFT_61917 [Melanogaster broomeanus]
MFKLHLFFFSILTFLVVDGAGYTIDNSDYSTLKYSENPSGPQWGLFGGLNSEILMYPAPNGTTITIDASQCWDDTYASDNCAVQFSFTGSGITIYVLQAGLTGMSASLTVDSAPATTTTLAAPPAPQYYIPRVPIFSVQNLVSGTHTAVMSVLDWNGGQSAMMLDYIDVNQAMVAAPSSSTPAPTPSPSPTPTPTPTTTTTTTTASQPSTSSLGSVSQTPSGTSSATGPAMISSQTSTVTASPASSTASASDTAVPLVSSNSKETNVAVIAGSAAGGISGLLGLCALAWFCFRRRRRLQSQALSETPSPLLGPGPGPRFTHSAKVNPFASTVASSPGASPPLQDVTSTSNPNLTRIPGPSSGNDPSRRSPLAASVSVDSSNLDNVLNISVSTATVAAAVAYPNEKLRQPSINSLSSTPTPSPDVPGAQADPPLTDGQADFVNSLYNNNVPGPVVARVLARMLANPQGVGGTGANDPELRPHLGTIGSSPVRTQTRTGAHLGVQGASEIGDGETTIGTAPPSYDFAQAQS